MRSSTLFSIAILAFLMLVVSYRVNAQQLPSQRGYLNQGILWNPALTAPGSTWETGACYQQQWIQFPGAPSTLYVYGQVPFVELNMSAGLVAFMDEAGPFLQAGGQASYAYKIAPGFFWKDQLSIGISGKASRMRFDANRVVAYDEGDDLLSEDLSGEWGFDFGAGIFYTSHNTFDFDQNTWYTGISVDQLDQTVYRLGTDHRVYGNRMHWRALAGYRFIKYYHCWEPSIYADMVGGGLFNVGGGVRYERDRRFWVSVGGELEGLARFGLGWIFSPIQFGSSNILIGAEADYGLSSLARYQGLSYQFTMAWRGLR